MTVAAGVSISCCICSLKPICKFCEKLEKQLECKTLLHDIGLQDQERTLFLDSRTRAAAAEVLSCALEHAATLCPFYREVQDRLEGPSLDDLLGNSRG